MGRGLEIKIKIDNKIQTTVTRPGGTKRRQECQEWGDLAGKKVWVALKSLFTTTDEANPYSLNFEYVLYQVSNYRNYSVKINKRIS